MTAAHHDFVLAKLASTAVGLMLALAFLTTPKTPLAADYASRARPAAPLTDSIVTDGGLDPTFNGGRFTNGVVTTAVLQPDGKLLIGGGFSKVHGVTRVGIARLNTDGTLDTSFDPGNAIGHNVRKIAVQPNDGRIVVHVYTPSPFFLEAVTLVRLNTDGSRDAGFDPGRIISVDGLDDGTGGAVNRGTVGSALLQPDGKFVLVGYFYHVITAPGASVPRSCIARFNSDGSFDASFDPGAGFETAAGFPQHVARQNLGGNSGKLIVEGHFEGFDNHPANGFVRLNANGSFDPTFNAGTGTEFFSVNGLFVQADDRTIVYGYFSSFNGVPSSGITRLNPDGSVDNSFSTGAITDDGDVGSILDVAQQPDGKLIIGGAFHSIGGVSAHGIARLHPTGAVDPTFAGEAPGPAADYIRALLVRPSDGKIFAGGYFSTYGSAPRNNIAWLNPDGTLDSTFEAMSGVTDYAPSIRAIAMQADGKIVAAGWFSSLSGTPRINLVRLNPDASIDSTFAAGLFLDGSIRALLIQPDGKFLIGGSFRAINGIRRGGVARLNADGTLDTSFDPGFGADGTVFTLMQDAQGSIYVGGIFDNFNHTPRSRLAKLLPSGALDPAFTSAGFSSAVTAIAPPDAAGRMLVAGWFSSPRGRIARIDSATGARDISYSSGATNFGFNGSVYALLRLPDGKYLAAGSFSSFSGLTRSRVARLTSDGYPDGTFVGPQLNGTATAVAVQNDKVFVGFFGSVANPSGQVIRLNSDGAFDSSFVPGSNVAISPGTTYAVPVPAVHALHLQPDGKLLLGGTFNNYNGAERICLARLTDSRLGFTAVSRKTHGSSGTFDIPLPATGSRGVECRSGGPDGNHQVVFTFPAPVSFNEATVSSGAGTVLNASGSGTSTITVDLTNVANAQPITLRLAAVSNGESTADLAVPMGILAGDTTGNGSVTASDIGQVKGQSGQPVSATNFRSDVTANGGSINASDIGLVKSRSGTQLPQ